MNKFLVGASTHGIAIQAPPRGLITPRDAFVLAAWLVVVAEIELMTGNPFVLVGHPTFDEVLKAVRNT